MLVPIQDGMQGPPLFCIHAIAGGIGSYLDLAIRLGEEQPVHGLQASAGLPAGTSIDDLACAYADLIASSGIGHPPVLCGWSVGGLIAQECARLLAEHGREPLLLVLIDPDPDPLPDCPAAEREREKWALRKFAILMLGPAAENLGMWEDAAYDRLAPEERLSMLYDLVCSGKSWFRSLCPRRNLMGSRFALFRTLLEARQSHVPRPYDGRTLLILAKEEGGRILSRWRSLLQGDIRDTTIDCPHMYLMDPPNIDEVAHALRNGIADALAVEAAGRPVRPARAATA